MRAYQESAAFVVADEVLADLVSAPSARAPIARDASIYIANGADQKAL
jgi:hypothetical protein